ncbi:MAG: methyltransferase domain-containing protein [Chloroflexi bacterium]|nr:methyltransferase domain-containing protein [Chloroflexota bacterium]
MTSATRSKPSDLYENIKACRICGSEALAECMSFGEQFLASAFVKTNVGHPLADAKVPLSLVLCGQCGMLQLKETVDRGALFDDYFYRSATNPMMRDALKDLIDDVTSRVDLNNDDVILDIGANDGTMLSFYPDTYRRVGVEPAGNISWDGLDGSINIVNDFFNEGNVRSVIGDAQCKIITSIAMMYSVPDLNAFAQDVKSLLADDGVWCIQLSYLPRLLETMSFYDVCHEHLYYFSLTTLNFLLERNGLSIFDVATNDVNGGSLRVFVTDSAHPREKTEAFHRQMQQEESLGLRDGETYDRFYRRVLDMKETINAFIRAENEKGEMVVGLGASTKGNVLLQFFGIDSASLPYISERNPEKVSLRTLGTDIELVSELRAREMNPSAMLVLIWFFKDELIKREREYLDNGGKLLFPMPYCHVVTKDGEERL